MKVCVCGWYFPDETYMSFWRINQDHPVHIVCNQYDERLPDWDLDFTTRDNSGLEWGAYNHYLMNIWDGDDVLFCHDDIEFGPAAVKANGELSIAPGEIVVDGIAAGFGDQSYIFTNRRMDVENYGKHGRMLRMSEALLRRAYDEGGFYYDENNRGYTGGPMPEGVQSYNAAINHFDAWMRGTGLDVGRKWYVPSIKMGVRGEYA